MKRNIKTIEETSEYKIFVDNIFGNIPLTFKTYKNTNLKDMKDKVGKSVIKSIGYWPEWTILGEPDPFNNIGLN